MAKYKIVLTCYDFDKKNPYFDEVIGTYTSEIKAKYEMFHCVLDELTSLNGIMADDTFPELRFIATTEDEHHDVVIDAWDGPDYRPVTCYDVMPQRELLAMLNEMLRANHGEHITVRVKSYVDDDGTDRYYYTSRKYGNSRAFDRATVAYAEADNYLRGVGVIY